MTLYTPVGSTMVGSSSETHTSHTTQINHVFQQLIGPFNRGIHNKTDEGRNKLKTDLWATKYTSRKVDGEDSWAKVVFERLAIMIRRDGYFTLVWHYVTSYIAIQSMTFPPSIICLLFYVLNCIISSISIMEKYNTRFYLEGNCISGCYCVCILQLITPMGTTVPRGIEHRSHHILITSFHTHHPSVLAHLEKFHFVNTFPLIWKGIDSVWWYASGVAALMYIRCV